MREWLHECLASRQCKPTMKRKINQKGNSATYEVTKCFKLSKIKYYEDLIIRIGVCLLNMFTQHLNSTNILIFHRKFISTQRQLD